MYLGLGMSRSDNTYRPILNVDVCRRRLSVGRRWATCRVRNEGLKKRSRTSAVNFWWWSVDHVTCLGVFANELAFCGRIAYRLLHFLSGSADNCLIFSSHLSSAVITFSTNNANNALQKQCCPV
jgi:hypothetical protein